VDYCSYPSGCENGDNISGGCCFIYGTPIVIDLGGSGFDLTDLEHGVSFAIDRRPVKRHVSWTEASARNAWLALDRNHNGVIDNGAELFGNFTDQPDTAPGEDKNGFRALALLDARASGGNENGRIDPGDRMFNELLLWTDRNHDGVSQPSELTSLRQADITAIDLDYRTSRRQDQAGNAFRFKAKVWSGPRTHVGRWAVDVYLLLGPVG